MLRSFPLLCALPLEWVTSFVIFPGVTAHHAVMSHLAMFVIRTSIPTPGMYRNYSIKVNVTSSYSGRNTRKPQMTSVYTLVPLGQLISR